MERAAAARINPMFYMYLGQIGYIRRAARQLLKTHAGPFPIKMSVDVIEKAHPFASFSRERLVAGPC
ncbi:MAG: hypothetical protein KDE14_15085, partial [Rhodobacteraceae bacterium]|nr:hypothetical protein [Paracoccaceae bacterium]